ncbi:MAG TPA: MFS transporter [Actinomycetales bacterium]|nr:MFS transporter [Actinomycetales bacterium]
MLGLVAVTYAVIEGGDLGYGSPVILAAVAVTVVAVVVFLGAQARGRHPMVPLDLFGSRVVATALVVALNPRVARVVGKHGRVLPIVGGLLAVVVGLVALSLLPADVPVLLVAAVMVPVGVGGSFTVPPVTAMILDHVPGHPAGTASGVLSTARQLGGSLAVAGYGAVVAGQASFQAGLRISLLASAVGLAVLAVAVLALHRAA